MVAIDYANLPFIQARNYTKTSGRRIDLVVIHDMEYPERMDAAEKVAQWFAGKTAPQASAHYCVDGDSIVRCVRDQDVAWHAPGANSDGIGIELAGYASQRDLDWRDAYSTAELHLAAGLTRHLCDRYGLPITFLDYNGLRADRKGITTHAQVSKAFGKTSHYDPGPGFPMEWFLSLVRDPDPNEPVQPGGGNVPAANAPFAKILVHPPTGGYLQIGEDGGVFAWGGAPFYGSTGGTALNQPIVDAEWTADYGGYFLLGRDGGVFAFGNARHQGNALYSGT